MLDVEGLLAAMEEAARIMPQLNVQVRGAPGRARRCRLLALCLAARAGGQPSRGPPASPPANFPAPCSC